MIKQFPGEPQIFQMIRGFGKNYLSSNPWPTRKHENFKYNSLDIFKSEFIDLPQPKNLDQIETKKNLGNESFQIVFINGHLSLEKSNVFNNQSTSSFKHNELSMFRILTLRAAVEKGLYPKEDLSQPKHSFEATNLLHFDEGIYIEVPENVEITTPLEILFYDNQNHTPEVRFAYHPRIALILKKNAKLTLLENYLSAIQSPLLQETSPVWTNVVVDVLCEEGSHLNWARQQQLSKQSLHFCKSTFSLASNSHLHFLTLAAGSQFHKHELQFDVNGENVELTTHGVSVGHNKTQIDHQVTVVFNKGESQLDQKFKSILNDSAQSIFSGKIIIQKHSQKTNASQLSQNLLLSDRAEAYTQPQLEIYADDVKAAHGATTGQLNEDEIFYLQSRGITRQKAIQILQSGFALELIESFPNQQIKNYLKESLL